MTASSPRNAQADPGPAVDRITVLRSGGLGDTLLILPICARLKTANPGARLRLVCDRRWLPVIVWSNAVDEAQATDDWPLHLLLAGADPSPLRPLFAAEDLVLCFSTGGDEVARPLQSLCNGRVVVRDPRFPDDATVHAVEHLAFEIPGVEGIAASAVLAPDPVALAWADDWLRANEVPAEALLVVHPGSGGEAKCWDLRGWAGLIDRASESLGARTVIALGPAELERWQGRLQPISAAALLLNVGLDQLGGLLARARVYAGNDSGPTHLAALLGVPTVAVFGPTDPRAWRPLGRAVWTCARSVDEVYAAVEQAWGRRAS